MKVLCAKTNGTVGKGKVNGQLEAQLKVKGITGPKGP